MSIPIETANIIRYKDLEELIKETYGREISIPENCERNNQSFLHISATKLKNAIIEMHIQSWVKWEEMWVDLDLIFMDLANKDLLPEGEYYVIVSW